MGSFYTNLTIKRGNAQEVAQCVSQLNRSGLVFPAEDGSVVYLDRETETQDPRQIEEAGCGLSSGLNSPVVGFLNHDDSILVVWLFLNGECVGTYNSCPDYFGEEDPSEGDTPPPLSAEQICQELGLEHQVAAMSEIMKPRAIEDFVMAFQKHDEICSVLGLPESSVGLGYTYAEAGELPPGLDQDTVIRVNL